MTQYLTSVLFCSLRVVILAFQWQRSARTGLDVLGDLDQSAVTNPMASPPLRYRGQEKLIRIGLFGTDEQRNYLRLLRLRPVLGAMLFLVIALIFGANSLPAGLISAAVGAAAGYLVWQRRLRRDTANYLKELEFNLPIVMERIVMAVQAGLDIIPALTKIVAIEREQASSEIDPVTKLLARVVQFAESGRTIEEALRDVASQVECPGIRHAFVHLSVAAREGGELVMPLKELSDATQLYYQETIEEAIAKLPIKATLPLLCTFAGLILFFLASPLIQVMSITAKAMPK